MKELNVPASLGLQDCPSNSSDISVNSFSALGVQIRQVSPANLREFLRGLQGEVVLPAKYDSESNTITTASLNTTTA